MDRTFLARGEKAVRRIKVGGNFTVKSAMALVVDLAGPVFRRLTKDKRTSSGHRKTDANDPKQNSRNF